MMRKKRVGFTTKYSVIFCAMILVISAALSIVLMSQSGNMMKTHGRSHMMAVASTAAALIDGDVVASFTEDSVGTEEYKKISDTLTTVKNAQKDAEIKYIYITKKDGDGFVFVVDPDPANPADFGEEVVYTEAQNGAWKGISGVDSEPIEDEWGYYYSAWSPVTDSDGKVVAVVGIDFSAEWYNAEIASHTRSVILISCLSLLAGGAVVFILAGKLRRRFRSLNSELTVLSEDLDELSSEINDSPEEKTTSAPLELSEDGADMIMALSGRIRTMQVKLKNYIRYIHEQAYTDSMTSVGNRTAYLDRVKEINREIENGGASFALAIFDINGLKATNDHFGHDIGDQIITDAADVICHVFPNDHVFRIGGDEFVAVVYNGNEEELSGCFAKLEASIASFNERSDCPSPLSFSHGGATFIAGEDREFKDVFVRADKDMYKNKADYYRRTGGAPHHSDITD